MKRFLLPLILGGVFLSCGRTDQDSSLNVEPFTVAKTAYEVASTALKIFEAIGWWPKKDPVAEVRKKVDEIGKTVDQIQTDTRALLDATGRIEDALVRQQQVDSLNEYLNAMTQVANATTALRYYMNEPSNSSHKLQADLASQTAVSDFQNRPNIFKKSGPLLSDLRFYHLTAYPGYLTAVNVRLAFLQIAATTNEITSEPYRTELTQMRNFVDTLSASIDSGIGIILKTHGSFGETLNCTHVTVTLVDNITFDPSESELEANRPHLSIKLPYSTCDLNTLRGLAAAEIEKLRTERLTQLGWNILQSYRWTIQNYISHGQAHEPIIEFETGSWLNFNALKNADIWGGDLQSFYLPDSTWKDCAIACYDRNHCDGFTYAPPGLVNPQGVCWLKSSIAVPVRSFTDGLISGMRRAVPNTSMSVEFNADLFGSDYERFNVSHYRNCAIACNNDSQCKAYTYVSPGMQESGAVCYKKNAVPALTKGKPGLISGVKYIPGPIK